MNRKSLVILLSAALFLFLAVPTVSASDILNPREGDLYNIGDAVPINGYLTLDENNEGAKVAFYAENNRLRTSILIDEKFYSFTKNIPVTFSQINKGTLFWKIPANISTSPSWQLSVKVIKGGTSVHSVESDTFEITKSLTVLAGVNTDSFNRGDDLELGGTVLSARGTTIEGVADVYLVEQNIGQIKTGTATSVNGYIHYVYVFKEDDLPGNYTIRVELIDSDGNEGYASITSLMLSDILVIISSVDKTEVDPNDVVYVTGIVENIRSEPLSNLEITAMMTVPNQETALKYKETTDANGKYAFTIRLPELAPPGLYPIEIRTNDSKGNFGLSFKELHVGIIKKLNVTLSLSDTDVSGELGLYLDTGKVKTTDFSASRGKTTSFSDTWKVGGNVGEHTIRARVLSKGEQLFETEPEAFWVIEQKTPFQLRWSKKNSFILLVLGIIFFVVYLKRQEIKEHFWTKELKKWRKGDKPISPE